MGGGKGAEQNAAGYLMKEREQERYWDCSEDSKNKSGIRLIFQD